MSEQINIWEKWSTMGRRLAVAFPIWVLNRLEKRSEGKGFAVKAIPFVIMFLSVASIANLAGRAFVHHANFSAYMTGAGIAVLVPIAVIAAMIVEGRWAWGFWAMAVVFAAISGTIQYNIYLMPNSGAMGIAEAIAFGYGVPLSEVMLAIMEARLVIQFDHKQAATTTAKAAEEKAEQERQRMETEQERQRLQAEQERETERQRLAQIDAENREFERQRKAAELEAYRLKLAQDAELERERVLADLRIKEQRAALRAATKPASESATSQKPTERSQSTGYDDQMAMLTIYRSEPSLSDEKMAAKIGKSKKTVQDLLADLVAKQVVHIEKAGRGKTVTVNGKFADFKNGKI